jgi:MFS family permease
MASFMVVVGFVVPYIAEDEDSGFGFSGLMTGLLFLAPAAFIQLATAPLFGRLATRIGFVTLLRIGLGASVGVVALLTIFYRDYVVVACLVALMGIVFMAMVMTAMSVLGVLQAPEDAPGSLPGISNAAYGIGSSIGFAWAGPIVGSGTPATFPIALWTCVGIGIVSFALSLVLEPRISAPATPTPVASG